MDQWRMTIEIEDHGVASVENGTYNGLDIVLPHVAESAPAHKL